MSPTGVLMSLAMALLCGVGCKPPDKQKKDKKPAAVEPLPVRAVALKKRRWQRAAHAVATVEPWRQVSLRAEAPGRILAIKHEVGDAVDKHALLVRLDGAVAFTSYRAARVGIKQAQVAIRLAKVNLARMKRLRASGDIPQAQLDQAQNAYDSARAALDMARARTVQAGTQLKNYWVRAPFAGVLASRPVNVGDYLSPGTPVFSLVEMKRLKVVVGLDPSEGLHLKKGHPAQVSLKTVQGVVTRKARVHLVRPLADAVTRRIELELQVDNPDRLLKPGVVAQVRIPLRKPEQRLLVPADAVVELVGRRYIYVVRDHKAQRLEVRLGVAEGALVEILPVGPKPAKVGEPLVVEGVQRLFPGAPVKVIPPEGKPATMAGAPKAETDPAAPRQAAQ